MVVYGGSIMSQREVARKLGLSVATVSTVERRALRKLRRHPRHYEKSKAF